VIGVRAFGSNPRRVGELGVATIQGQHTGGVASVAKHFPGHGDTSVDSHLDLPVVAHPLQRLESTELEPFRQAIQAGVDGIMTAHVVVPSVESRPGVPATLSHAVLTGLLRDKLGYDGLVLTDALDMGAITRDRSAAEAAVQAFEAGADMLLVAGIKSEDRARLGEGPRALLEAVQSGRVSQSRLDTSVLRILEAKSKRGMLDGAPPQGDLSEVGSVAHRALAQEAATRSATLIRDDAGLLPIHREQRVLVVTTDSPTRSQAVDDSGEKDSLAARIGWLAGPAGELQVTRSPSEAEIAGAVSRARQSDVVVLATYDLAQQGDAQQRLARALAETGRPMVGVALRGPYDASAAPFIRTWIAVYGDRPVQLQAAAALLAGATKPTGRLPVQLP
jgi:beta-N-acetylhexosaminidase